MFFDKNAKFDEVLPLLPEYIHRKIIPDTGDILNHAAKVRIAQVRRFFGVPKTTLAKMLGTSYRQYLRYEDGLSALPVTVISFLAYFYNLSADFLCGLKDTPEKLYKGDPIDVNGFVLTSCWCVADNEAEPQISPFCHGYHMSSYRELSDR